MVGMTGNLVSSVRCAGTLIEDWKVDCIPDTSALGRSPSWTVQQGVTGLAGAWITGSVSNFTGLTRVHMYVQLHPTQCILHEEQLRRGETH